jgi:hypothetical protein
MNSSVRARRISVFLLILFFLLQTQSLWAQESAVPRSTATTAMAAEPQAAGQIVSSPSQVVPALPVPRLIKFSGVAKDASGQPRSGVVGIMFSVYASQEGGTALWMETQNVELDAHGHYAVLLGSSQSAGMPLDLFTTGEPRWLGAKVELPGEVEQPRVLLVSVPYALKASDADTVGGMPASAFVLAPAGSGAGAAGAPGAKSKTAKSGVKSATTCTSCLQNWVPLFTDSSGDVTNSVISQTNGSVAIGTKVAGSQNALLIVGNGGGGNMFNGSNDVDTDFFVTLTAPGATPPVSTFGPSVGSNLALQVGGAPKLWITNSGNVGIATTTPGQSLDVEGSEIYSNGYYDGIDGFGFYNGGYFGGGYDGVFAYTGNNSNGYAGVYGFEEGSTAETIGVYGKSYSPIGAGVYGQDVSASNEGALVGYYVGLWGDTGQAGNWGVLGTADDGEAVVGYNNSPSGNPTAYFENDENASSSDLVFKTWGGSYSGSCTIDVSGNLGCTGLVAGVVPVQGGSKKVALNAVQSPENWFEDAGGAQLSGGEAVVNIESVFGETVNTGVDYRIFLTPNGDCKGLYVAQKSATSFVVRELGGGTSNIAFDYRIMAKRKGFEQVRLADKTELFNMKNRVKNVGAKHVPTAEEVRKRVEKHVRKPQSRPVAQVKLPVLNQKQ